MSTYSGDAQIVDVITVSLSVINANGSDSYAIPAGQFGEAQLLTYSSVGHGVNSSASVSMGGVLLDATAGADISGSWKDFPDTMIINEGGTVSVTQSVFSATEDIYATFIIILKNNP